MLPPLDELPDTLRNFWVAPAVYAAENFSLQTCLAMAVEEDCSPLCRIIRSLLLNKDEQATEHRCPTPEPVTIAEETEDAQSAPDAPETPAADNEPASEAQASETLHAQTGQAEDTPAQRGPRLVMTSALMSALTSARNDKRRTGTPPAASTSTPANTNIPPTSPSRNSSSNEGSKVKRVRRRRRRRTGRGSGSNMEDAVDQPE